MDDAAQVILLEDFGEQGLVPHVTFIEFQLLSGELLHPLQGFGIGIAQIVNDHHPIAAFQQLQAGMGANIPGAAGNKYVHKITSVTDFSFILLPLTRKINGKIRLFPRCHPVNQSHRERWRV